MNEIDQQIRRFNEKLKKVAHDGVHDGLVESQPYLESRMKYYMKTQVYDAYNPKVYERTGRLMESIQSEVDGTTIRVYSNGNSLMNYTIKSPPAYNYYVLKGKYLWNVNIGQRDWITPMKMEFKNHTEQEGVLMDNIVKSITKRWNGS
ncbi:MAG: hypothetical protein Q8910_00445 [Bacteroidota bacterium]|nr:hypothetical protein [Bacteroidota bacterium]